MNRAEPAAARLAHALADAARIVSQVADGRSLSAELASADRFGSTQAARIDLTHGTLRRFGISQFVVARLAHRGAPEARVQALLWCALYALESGRYQAYTVVDQCVQACGLLDRAHASGFVNGVLRRYLRERDAILAAAHASPEARLQFPRWWLEMLERDYPDQWERIAAAGNLHPPMCLRVNTRKLTVEAYLQRLSAAGIHARVLEAEGLLLEAPVPVGRLPGFEDGLVSVQDAGAQRAAHFLDAQPGQRVLDACAAPGGKSAHLLELADITLTALDIDPARCERVRANLARLGLSAEVRSADCLQPAAWWDGRPFQRILADVPCSASGIARRRPDARWLRRPGDLEAFARRQGDILDGLWRLLAPGGKLLYATCSVFVRENASVIQGFLARTPGAARQPLPEGSAAQLLPDENHDGFFYALIARPD